MKQSLPLALSRRGDLAAAGGGSWMVERDLMRTRQFDQIRQRVIETMPIVVQTKGMLP